MHSTLMRVHHVLAINRVHCRAHQRLLEETQTMAVMTATSIPTTKSELPMAGENVTEKKRPGRVTISPEEKFLVGRVEAADMLSISRRALDYLVANKQLTARRIGARVLIPVADLRRFSRGDHPARLAG